VKEEIRAQEVKEGDKAPGSQMPDSESYTETIRKKLDSQKPDDTSGKSYIEKLRESDPLRIKESESENYSDKEKQKLEPQPEGGAIQALKEGHSELQARKEGKIHHAFGIRYTDGSLTSRDYTLSNPAKSFSDIYGGNYSPEVSVFYEYQPWHSEWYGNLGFVAIAGVGYFHALGKLGTTLPKPDGSGNFDITTGVKLQFFTIPVTVGLSYRFNLFKYVRPYVMAGPTVIGFLENRSDNSEDRPNNRGNSRAFTFSAGTAILLDWISGKDDWNMYQNYTIKHYYITLEFMKVTTFSGDVDFNSSGFVAGFAFEY
jgi:hypothetical protein